MAGELLEFENGVYGMAQNLESNDVGIVILGMIPQSVKVIPLSGLVGSWKCQLAMPC